MISSATPRSRSKRRIWKPSSKSLQMRREIKEYARLMQDQEVKVRAAKTEATVAREEAEAGPRGRRSPDRFRSAPSRKLELGRSAR